MHLETRKLSLAQWGKSLTERMEPPGSQLQIFTDVPGDNESERVRNENFMGLHYPFQRPRILERFINLSDYDYISNFISVPQLDNLRHDMVNTGRVLDETGSEVSFASSEGGALNMSETPQNSCSIKGRQPAKKPEKRFSKWGRKKKPDPPGWDLFPGISAAQSANGKHEAASKQTQSSQGSQPSALPVPEKDRSEPKRGTSDLLARTFDIMDLQAAEVAPSSEASEAVKRDPIGEDTQSTAGERPPSTTSFEEDTCESGTGSSVPSTGGLSVKDTCKLHVHTYKEITFVNEYALITAIGRGSFGEVKLALNLIDMEVYALKLISKTRQRRSRIKETGKTHLAEASVMSEINVMKELSHPNLVRLVEVIDDPTNQKILMVLEYVEGGSLFAGTIIAPKKRLSEMAARKYFRDILQGLSYLHANKVAHGDLKPDNFLLAPNGHLKIADFGSSQLTRVGDLVSRAAGTPAFMAPEMCSGHPYQARLADIWALGISLYMFVFGRVPFKSESMLGLYDEICNTPLSFPEDVFVSDSLKHLLFGLLDKNANKRIDLLAVMSHPWVTYNGECSLLPPSLEVHTPARNGLEGELMESWKDDPEERVLLSALSTLAITKAIDRFQDGDYLVNYGDIFEGIFKIEEGLVEVQYYLETSGDSDEEEEQESSGLWSSTHKRQRTLQILEAANKACEVANAKREFHDGRVKMISRRGLGNFVGEPREMGTGPEVGSGWHMTVQAMSFVRAKYLEFGKFFRICSKFPEVEADGRALFAQRRGEFLKQALIEQLASLRDELQADVNNFQSDS